MQVVIGLGNPGPRYAATRHNIGFVVADRLAGDRAWSLRPDLHCHMCHASIAGRQVCLVKPQTFMNASGQAVAAVGRHLETGPEDMLVVFDDFLLDFGRVRLRRKGSDGGHNGLASVLEHMGTDQVPRLRLGIGAPGPGTEIIDYVLSPFGADEDVDGLVQRGCQAAVCCLEADVETAMNRYNGCGPL